MAVSSDQIKGLIDSNLPDATDRRNKAGIVRTLLKMVVDWVRDAVNGNLSTWFKVGTAGSPATNAEDVYRTGKVVVGRTTVDGTGAALQSSSASLGVTNVTTINGLSQNNFISFGPVGPQARRYFKIGTLPDHGPNNFSRFEFEVVVGAWTAGGKNRQRVMFETRDSFVYSYIKTGPNSDCGVAVYRDVAGAYNVYLNMNNAFSMGMVTVLFNNLTTLTPSLPEELSNGQPATPSGTLVLNTVNTDAFPPN